MTLDETIQLQVLKRKAAAAGVGRITDALVEQSDQPNIRQMCAKVSVQLVSDLDEVCGALDISKRAFIESAVADAVAKAQAAVSHLIEEGAL